MESPKKRSRQRFLSAADENILYALATYRYLTTQQLLRVLGLANRPKLSLRLAELVTRGYLYTEPFRQTYGSPNVYILTTLGKKYLADSRVGAWTLEPTKLRDTLASSSMPHTLAVNDALIAFTQLPRSDPAWSVVTLLHDYQLKKQPFLIGKKKVIPDGWVKLHYWTPEGTDRFCFPLEVQHRGHATADVIQQKVREYIAIAAQDIHRRYFNDPHLPMTPLFLATRGDTHVRFIKHAMEAELRDKKQWAGMFYVAPLTPDIVSTTIVYNAPVWQQPFAEDVKPLWEWV
jgi:hypothetical protein